MGTSLSAVVAALPLERRIALCAGADLWHVAELIEAEIPALRMTDGPNGARGHVFDGEPSICFPVGSALAATWNVELVARIGSALAQETRAKGAAVLLAPTVNLHRHPVAGRLAPGQSIVRTSHSLLIGPRDACTRMPDRQVLRAAHRRSHRRIVAPTGEPGAVLELFEHGDSAGVPAVVRDVRSMSQRFYGEIEGLSRSDRFTARLTATYRPDESGVYRLGVASSGSTSVSLDGVRLVRAASSEERGETFYGWGTNEHVVDVALQRDVPVEFVVDFHRDTDASIGGFMIGLTPPEPPDMFDVAVRAAAKADVAVVVVGLNERWETEGHDRLDLTLPGRQDELVSAIAAANRSTIVIINAGSPVAMPWLGEVGAVVHAWYPGQAFGEALAQVLHGDVSPSGKLPTTFPHRLEDTPAFDSYPGADGHVAYREGIYVGYRHYDRDDAPEPLFPFGHGLSCTTFDYGPPRTRLSDDGLTVVIEAPVTNTGTVSGAEVVQLYVSHPHSSADRPVRELRGFARQDLAPGETGLVTFEIGWRDLAYWDVEAARWRVDDGDVVAHIAASSRDLRTSVAFTPPLPTPARVHDAEPQ